MGNSIFQAKIENRGLILDPRTKFIVLFTMFVFVLGYAEGEELAFLMPFFCLIPALALLSAKKYKMALIYFIVYLVSHLAMTYGMEGLSGLPRFLLFGFFGIIARFLPCLMMGAYLVSTTTVSEFTAAMLRVHLSEKIIIPLSVMFRFFPTVIDEFRNINAAMKMRDITLAGKNASKFVEYRIVPLMSCCVKIGEELSAAALTRGLAGDVKRTNICKIGFHSADIIILILCFIPYVFLVLSLLGVSL